MKLLYFCSIVILLIVLVMVIKANNKVTVVFFGDSITDEGNYENGYIRRIEKILKDEEKLNNHELIGTGIAGNKIDDLYRRLEDDVITADPDVVVIYIGINDVWKQPMGDGTTIGEFEKYYAAIINKLRQKNIKVALCTLSVIGEKKNAANAEDANLDTFSGVVKKLAIENNCMLIDLRTAFVKYEEEHNPLDKEYGILTIDGVHLNDRGNQLVADEMIKILFTR